METVQELTLGNIPIVFYYAGTPGGKITKIGVNYRKGVEACPRMCRLHRLPALRTSACPSSVIRR